MSERKKVLEFFESQKDYMDDKIKNGIEENRKGYAEIAITDSEGNPVKGAKIKAVQKSHEYRFGANIFMLDELETEEKNEKYKTAFAELFNMATLPFYWDATEPEKGHTRYAKDSEKLYRRPAIDLCIEFCEKHGIEPREHALAYEHFFPQWLKDASIFEVKCAYENRCREISERYKTKIPTIEVTNELLWDEGVTAFYQQPDFIEWCFKTAEKYFPANTLACNELTGTAWGQKKYTVDLYYSYIQDAIARGARIDAIGLQFHMFFKLEEEYKHTRQFYNPENLYKTMDWYANLNKPLQITEVTVPAYTDKAEDEELQAEILRKLYSIWFSHKNTEQIIYWNLVDGYAAFAPLGDMTAGENYYRGGLMRFDMTPKPAYFALKDLIEKEWHTDAEISANDCGIARFKGFYGKYDVTIETENGEVKKEINLYSKSRNKFKIEL